MTTTTDPASRSTADPVPASQLRADVGRLLDVLADGGVGIVPLDVAYAIVAATPEGIRRIFDAKQRSYEKPSGFFGDADLCREIHLMGEEKHEMVRTINAEERVPFSVVGAFRERFGVELRITETTQGRGAE